MSPKYFCVILLSFVNVLITKSDDKISFTLVIDDTTSMGEEIAGVKLAANRIFEAVLNTASALVENYVLVTINDPYVELRTITKDPDKLKRHLNSIMLGNPYNMDCPEMAMAGVELAMENSLPHSLVYVFTDADAKDSNLLEKVKNLAYRKQIQLVFILTDSCYYGRYDPTYSTLAEATNGVVFTGSKADVNKILNYAVESVKTKRKVIGKGTFPPGAHNMTVYVDPTMKDMISVAVGKDVKTKVYNPDGTLAKTESVIDTSDSKAVKVNCTEPGNYDLHIESKSNSTLVVQASTSLDFNHGFSTTKPLSLPGTSILPLPDVKSHLAIDLICDEEVILETVELHDLSDVLIKEIGLEKLRDKFYVTDGFIPPNGLFYITIKGFLTKTKSPIKRTSSTPVEPQNRKYVKTEDRAPKIVIDKGNVFNAEYDQPLSIACNVEAYPEPKIIWYDDEGNEIENKVENYDIPYGFKSILEIAMVNKNTTYKCRASNTLGVFNSKVRVQTKRKEYFNVLTRPTDVTIEYKKSGNVICSIDSYPPSIITWRKETKELVSDSKIDISSDKGIAKLNIKEMTADLNGTYSCEADNGVTQTAINFNIIAGEIAPVVSIEGGPQEIVDYDDPIELKCRVSGFPAPDIIWKEKETGNILPSTTIASVDKEYDYVNMVSINQSVKNSTYQCSATNTEGADSKDIEVVTKVHIHFVTTPKDLSVGFQKSAKVECEVEANPLAAISWYKDGIKVLSDSNIDIEYGSNESSSLRIAKMKPDIVGRYSCKAENDFLTEEVNFGINITGTAPTTVIDGAPKINAEYDEPLSVLCKVSGYPEPEIVWLNKSTGKEIASSLASVDPPFDHRKLLKIDRVNKNETYTCRANNNLGEHSSQVQIETVRKNYFNILEQPKDITIEYKKSGNVICSIDSYPPSVITWSKESKELVSNSEINISSEKGIAKLNIKEMTADLNGTYLCVADNGITHTTFSFNLMAGAIAPVVSIEEGSQEIVDYDDKIELKCRVSGFPAPDIIWKEKDTGNTLPSRTIVSVDKKYDYVNILSIDHSVKNATYQCSANNTKGADNKDIEVVTKVHIHFVTTPKDLNVEFKKTGEVKCKVDASPPAIISWYKDGIKVLSDNNTDIQYGSDGSSNLRIAKMKPNIVGRYSCKAVNDFLTEEVNFGINITGTGATTVIDGAPKINAEYDETLSVLCKVSGYPEPEIVWFNKSTGKEIASSYASVDPPFDHGKVLQIDRVNRNETYTCRAKNPLGEHTSEVQIETVRKNYFDIFERPKDTKIKYRGNGEVLCNVNADPPATVVWYANGNEILNNSTHISISENHTVLMITNMQPDLKGNYVCRTFNINNHTLFDFNVFITGIIVPVIDKSTSLVTILEGSKGVINCRILRGDPAPTISWRFRTETERKYRDLNETGNEIIIENATRDQAGVFRCIAANDGGTDRLSIAFVVEYAPTINRRNKKSITLMVDDTKILYCDADGEPKPTVTWFLNDVPVHTAHYNIYSDYSIKIVGSARNVGEFKCRAENKHGKEETTTKVDYVAPVEIAPPSETNLEVMEGEELKMVCEADGHPRPKIKWDFFPRNDSTPRLLKYADSPDTLVIPSAQLERSGFYVCSANNVKSSSNMTYEVTVNAPPRIIYENTTSSTHTSESLKAVKGDFVVRVPCKATGWPKPEIRWIKNGLFIASGTKWYEISDDGTLLIKNIDESGLFICNATNKFGSDERSYEVLAEDFTTPSRTSSSTLSLVVGDTAHVNCDLPHSPVDQLRWYKDGKLLIEGELTLNSVEKIHSGFYTCRVSTLSGSDSSTVSIVVEGAFG